MNTETLVVTILIFQVSTTRGLEKFVQGNFNNTIVVVSSDFQNWNPKLEFLLKENVPKLVTSPKLTQELTPSVISFIIIEADFKNLISTINHLLYKFNHRSKVLVIFQNNSTEDDLKSTFATLWSYYIHNVVVHSNWSNFVTWYPYSRANSCGTNFNLVTNAKSPFSNKIPKNIKGCSVNLTWNPESGMIRNPFDSRGPGYGAKFLKIFTEKTKVEIEYLKDNIEYFKIGIKTGKLDEMIKDMLARKIDMAVTVSSRGDCWGKEVESSQVLDEYDQYFVLPPRKVLSYSEGFVQIYSPMVWKLFLVCFFAISVLWTVIMKQRFEISLFYMIQVTIQNATHRAPRNTLARFIFMIYLFNMLILNWCYFSSLSSVLTTPIYEPKVQTIADLLKTDKKLKYLPFYKRYLSSFDNETFKQLTARRDPVWEYRGLFNNFLNKQDHALILSERWLVYIFNNPERLQIATYNNIFTAVAAWSVRKGFPFLDRLNYWIVRVVESGLVKMWIDEETMGHQKLTIPEINAYDHKTPLSFEHVTSAFRIYFGGLTCAFLCFLAEILYQRCTHFKYVN